jgi:GNAT superfamily N-acetyltransferase
MDMTTPAAPGHVIEPATAADTAVLSQVIADAFFPLAVSRWLIPDEAARRDIFPAYWQIHLSHALAAGLVHTTPQRDAAALWLVIPPDGPEDPTDAYQRQLAAVTGKWLDQFTALDKAFARHHPAGVPHSHLAVLAVRPGRQRHGIGTAMLRHQHATLDRAGTAAYLEASDPDKRDIYLRHGYLDHGDPISLPDGPQMFPMWRLPRRRPARPQLS